nr:hypothetical protein [Clostridia bacterium]
MKSKIFTRITALLLLTGILTLTACSSDTTGKPSETTANETNLTAAETTTAGETDRADAKDSLPDGLKFDGKQLNFLVRGDHYMITDYDMIGEENSGDVVLDAVYRRNRSVEDRLGLDLNMILSKTSNLNDMKAEMQKVVMSGSTDYDAFATSNNSVIQFGMVDSLRVFNDAPYIDFDAPWWWTQSMLDLSLDGETVQYLIGDLLMSNILTSAATYANKDIWRDYLGNPDDLYQLVLDGGWTFDKFSEYASSVYSDLNGDGVLNEGDLVGIYGNVYQTIDYFSCGSDIFLTKRASDGTVELNPPDNKSVAFVEKMIDLYYNKNAAFVSSGETKLVPGFTNSKCLFLADVLLSTTKAEMREFKSDYAIVPMPKFDETQENYKTVVYGHSGNISAPVTVNDETFEALCAALEALCAEGYRSVTETMYEVALKTKFSRDEMSGQMLDIITSTACKNFSNEYAAKLPGLEKVYKNAITTQNIVVMSLFESVAPAVQTGLDELTAKIADLK